MLKCFNVVGPEKGRNFLLSKGLHSQNMALNCRETLVEFNFLAKHGGFYAAQTKGFTGCAVQSQT